MNRPYVQRVYTNRAEEESRRAADSALYLASERLLSFFDLIIAFLLNPVFHLALRVSGSFACFFAFLFVVGAVESGALTLGGGVLLASMLVGIAFLCVFRLGERRG